MYSIIKLPFIGTLWLVSRIALAQGSFTPSSQLSFPSQTVDTGRTEVPVRSVPVTYLERPIAVESPSQPVSKPETPLPQLDKDSLRMVHYVDSLVTLRVQAILAADSSGGTAHRPNHSATTTNRLRHIPSILPFYVAPDQVTGLVRTRMSSAFGLRQHPVLGGLTSHAGIDLPAPLGTLVYATADGICRQLINQPEGIGLAIYISHERGHQTVYGHLLTTWIKPGEPVRRGQIIGRVGTSGMTTGPHLHYGIRCKGQVVDPLPYCFLLAKSSPVTGLPKKK